MRTHLPLLVISLTLIAAFVPQNVQAEIPFVTEELKVEAPYGETVFTLYHNTRVPNEYYHPLILFSDKSGASKEDTLAAEAFATNAGWVVLLDENVLLSKVANEAQFVELLVALAEAIKGKMSEAMGPRLKGMPERKWAVTFGGRGTGGVRASDAAIKFEGHGVRGLVLTDPASEAPAFGKEKAPIVLLERVRKLGVTPVAIIAPAETEELEALNKAIPGFSTVTHTPAEALPYITKYYQVRHRMAPRKAEPADGPASLFHPGP